MLNHQLLPFEFFFNEKSFSNLLFFSAVASKFRITIDAELEPYINVHLHGGIRIIFNKYRAGLYYFDTTNEAFNKDQTTDYTLPNTVDINKLCFHRRRIKGADEARILLHYAIIFTGLLAGEILFWGNSKISFALDYHSQEKNWIRISI